MLQITSTERHAAGGDRPRSVGCVNAPTALSTAASSFNMALQVFLLLALSVIPVQSASFQTNSIEGWTTLVNERLLAEDKAGTVRALELLRAQLKEIVRVAPPLAVAKLREVRLWLSPEYPGVKPTAEYHPI